MMAIYIRYAVIVVVLTYLTICLVYHTDRRQNKLIQVLKSPFHLVSEIAKYIRLQQSLSFRCVFLVLLSIPRFNEREIRLFVQ